MAGPRLVHIRTIPGGRARAEPGDANVVTISGICCELRPANIAQPRRFAESLPGVSWAVRVRRRVCEHAVASKSR